MSTQPAPALPQTVYVVFSGQIDQTFDNFHHPTNFTSLSFCSAYAGPLSGSGNPRPDSIPDIVRSNPADGVAVAVVQAKVMDHPICSTKHITALPSGSLVS